MCETQWLLLPGKKKLTSGFCSRFPFERSFEKTLNAATVWHTEHHWDEMQEDKDTHTCTNPFIGWLRFLWSLLAYVEFLYTVFLHVQIPCLLAQKPQTSTCACSGGELHYNSTAHYSAFATTLSLATILHLQIQPPPHYIYLSKLLLYNTGDFCLSLQNRKSVIAPTFDKWYPGAAKAAFIGTGGSCQEKSNLHKKILKKMTTFRRRLLTQLLQLFTIASTININNQTE